MAPSLSLSSPAILHIPVILLLISSAAARLDNTTSPTSTFRSRPDLHAPIIKLTTLEPHLVSPGYIFLAPYRNLDPGPYIYDNNGQLVWSGAGTFGSSTVHNPHVCKYKRKDHICFFQGNQHHGWARGHGVILDERYRVVQTVEAVGGASTTDMHEFRLINSGKNALVTIYQPRAYDLSPFGIGPGLGWIQDSVFQEIDVESGELVFEWRALDHIAPSFSYTCISCTDTSGDGLTRDTPWDFFHINSIDKNVDGDYLVSARHVGAVYKISGATGKVLWELGGANPTFKNVNLHFSSQHHALWIKENATHTVISLFDNASNTFNITNRESRGMLIGINHVMRMASKLRTWEAPGPEGKGILAGSQGNMQILDSGNVFIGWGDHAVYSEHTAAGKAVTHGQLAAWGSDVMMYRCNKHPWEGKPLTAPSLWSYSKTGKQGAGTVFYVSWNGATEVERWNFYAGDSSNGPWEMIGSTAKDGFETKHHALVARNWSFAEAVDIDGKKLKRSSVTRTFVPSIEILEECDDTGCVSVPPLANGKKFDMRLPEVPNRGENYTRGYDTAKYYPKIPAFGSWSIPSAAYPLGLFVVAFMAVEFLVGKRKALRLGGLCLDLISARFKRTRVWVSNDEDPNLFSISKISYRKLEEREGMS